MIRMADVRHEIAPTEMVHEMAAEHLQQLFMADRVATSIAAAVLLVIGIAAGVNPWVFVLVAIIMGMAMLRRIGMHSLREGRTDRAVGWFAAGSWGVTVGVVLIIPVALPILVITLVIPAVLSATYQTDRQVQIMTGGLIIATLVAGVLARWSEGAGLEDSVDPNVVSLALVLYLAAQNLPLVMAVRYSSRQYRLALEHAVHATEAAQQAEAEVRRSRARLAEASTAERRKIERDLHDGAQQQFLSSLVQLRVIDQALRRGREPDLAAIADIADDLEHAIEELRRLARGIYPSLLQTQGLYEALNSLARASVAPTTVVGHDPGVLPDQVATALYFFASEALQNVAKHAGTGATAEMRLDVADDIARLEVRDDGNGFSADRVDLGSRGLVNMRDRVEAVGGLFDVSSAPAQGCCLVANVPVGSRATAAVGALS